MDHDTNGDLTAYEAAERITMAMQSFDANQREECFDLLGKDTHKTRKLAAIDSIVRAGYYPYSDDGLMLLGAMVSRFSSGPLLTDDEMDVSVEKAWRLAEKFGFLPDWPPPEF